LFASWPYWFDASRYEWSCARGPVPRVLEDTDVCARCRDWAPELAETAEGAGSTLIPGPATTTRRDNR
jgi:hypothetical protein